ncbi:PEP-CTERM sorting domain-containing protein [Rubritalea sp.]|uniref:PEP-CTERM sorting domain-containing protein n=1 Tax=Rubritalea sp. TaxID=2109375 RepID=UPI003EF873C2
MNTSKFKLLAVAATCCGLSSASAVTLYENGVLASDGLTLTDLQADGWTVIYNEFYDDDTSFTDVADWATATGTGSVFIGALDLSGNVLLGATGTAEVLTVTNSDTVASSYASSNLHWYNYNPTGTSGSVGFALNSDVTLNSADTATADGEYRLSWHTHGDVGGYRVGSTTSLNSSTDYVKVVLVSAAVAAVPEPSSIALLGLGSVALLFRRKRA